MKMQFELLVAEDDIGNFLLFKRHFTRWGFNVPVRHFINGSRLTTFLQEDLSDEKDYVILLDLDMPVMNGFDALKKIKENPRYSKVRVFIRTTDKSQETISRCCQLGCDGYFIKPMTKYQIADVLNQDIDKFITASIAPEIANSLEPVLI